MKILIFHNYYRYPGGEDVVYMNEEALLVAKGQEVFTFTLHNQALDVLARWRQAAMAMWNGSVYRELRRVIREKRPRLVHVHNTFPLASPAVIRAAKSEGVPVIMTLHNYRLLCVNALLFHEGQVCEDCLGRLPWRGMVRKCYRESLPASGVVAGMLVMHRVLGTWGLVDRFIALTEFARTKFIEGGLPAEKIIVKPNFVYPDPGVGEGRGGYALFVGRLAPEKGVRTLLKAWDVLADRVPLKIVGDGPLVEEVRSAAERLPGVEWLGWRSPEDVYALMGEAAFLLFPSESYETFGRVAIEAFAKGTPVIAANIGAVGEITEHGRTGLHFRPGDPLDLAEKVEWLLARPKELLRMRKEARAEFEAKYTAERNYELLMSIYEGVMKSHVGR